MNAKISGIVTCVEAVIYLLLDNFHDFTFNICNDVLQNLCAVFFGLKFGHFRKKLLFTTLVKFANENNITVFMKIKLNSYYNERPSAT